MKGDKLGRQGGSGSQKRNHEERQAWESRRQRQPKAKSGRETSLRDKAAAAGRQGGSGSQERNHEGRQAWQGGSGSGSQFPQSGTHPFRSKKPYSFAIWGKSNPSPRQETKSPQSKDGDKEIARNTRGRTSLHPRYFSYVQLVS